MKLKAFRIINIIRLSVLALLGLAIAIFNIIVADQRQADSYLLYLICFFIGFLFLSFEVYFIAKSFKSGTLLLHDICLVNNSNIKRKTTLIVASILGALALGYFFFNVCAYAKLININQGPMALEFNMYFCLILLINCLTVINYWIFIWCWST